jgi:hypothetical protein
MSQYEPVDMLMYYDARPCGMNGMFNTDMVCEKLKGYYPFYMFNQLYKLDEAVALDRASDDVWAVAARGEEHDINPTDMTLITINNFEFIIFPCYISNGYMVAQFLIFGQSLEASKNKFTSFFLSPAQ